MTTYQTNNDFTLTSLDNQAVLDFIDMIQDQCNANSYIESYTLGKAISTEHNDTCAALNLRIKWLDDDEPICNLDVADEIRLLGQNFPIVRIDFN